MRTKIQPPVYFGRSWRQIAALMVLGLSGLLQTTRGFADTNSAPVATNGVIGPEDYQRLAYPDTNTEQLQIAVRKFVPSSGKGPVILLAGTAHLGDPEYYKALQKLLDAQTVVLFEGVNADSHPRRVRKPGEARTPNAVGAVKPLPPPVEKGTNDDEGTNAGFSMQSSLAKALGLVFQLEAINYDRTNFLNSDLSVLDIQRLMLGDPNAPAAEPGDAGRSSASFDMLLQIMDGSSFLGSIVKWGISLIGSDPQLQATTKFTLVEALGGLKGDFSQMRGLPPEMQHLLEVLIQARNQNVMDDLRTELQEVPANGSIAIFYGTGHMPDMEKRVVRDFHYRPAGDQWFTAISVDLDKTGMPASEIKWMRNMIKWQLDQMQPEPAKPADQH